MKPKTDMSKAAVTHRLNQMEGLWLLCKALGSAKVVSKNASGRNRALMMRSEIHEILIRNWKPLKLGAAAQDRSYDKNIGPILRVLVGSREVPELIELLQRISRRELNAKEGTPEEMNIIAAKLLKVSVKLS